jgi:pimeloyl-ACP methyl ester carboxylesterase
MSRLQHAGSSPRTAAAGRPARQADVLEAHRRAGRFFQAAGVRSFVREQGAGPAVLCMHGMIGSSFLYRKVLAELAARGLRGVAFDLPGFGLAGRPAGYDYSWTGLGKFCLAAVDELGLGDFHLVVQAIWAADDPTMTLAVYGEKARAAAGLPGLDTVPGKHFPQEDQAPAIAEKITELALRHDRGRLGAP